MSLPLSAINTIEKKIRAATNFQYVSSQKTDAIIDALTQMSARSGMAVYIWMSNAGLVNIRSRQTPLPATRSILEALKYATKNHYFAVYVFPGINDADLLELKSTLPSATAYLNVSENTRFLFLMDEAMNFNFLKRNAEEIKLENKHVKKYKLRDAKWVVSNS